MKTTTSKTRGFTLIEMMVVIAIIGILVAIVYASFSDARKQSRDKTRQIQLEELRVALELYKDKYGRYPASGCNAQDNQWAGPAPDAGAQHDVGDCDVYIEGLVPEFLDELPADPRGTLTVFTGFYYITDGIDYKAQILGVEALYVDSRSHPLSKYPEGCSEPIARTIYAVYSVGALCW